MSQSSTDALSQDQAYDLLSNSRRRYVISQLREERGPVELNELSRRLAAWENETPVEDLTDQQKKRVYVSLYQTHIPKLADAGIIDYDSEAGTVELEDTARELDTYIPHEAPQESPWVRIYLAVSLLGLVIYATSVLSPQTLFGLDTSTVGAVILLAFGALTAAHYLTSRRP
jgi:hypothetical protein